MTAGSCSHSAPRAFMKSNTVQFIPKVLDGAEVSTQRPPVKFFDTKVGKPFFFQKALCVELSHVGTAKGQTQTVAMQSMIPLCVISLRSPFSGTMKVCGHIAHVLCDDIEIYLDFVTSLIYESTHNSNRQQKKTLKKTLKNRCGV